LQLQLLLPVIGPAKSSWCLFLDQTRPENNQRETVLFPNFPCLSHTLIFSGLLILQTYKINHKSLKHNLTSTKTMQKGDQILPLFHFYIFCMGFHSHTIFILSYPTSQNYHTHMFGYVSLDSFVFYRNWSD